MEESSILKLLIITHSAESESEKKSFDCLAYYLPGPIGHFQLLMTLCLIVKISGATGPRKEEHDGQRQSGRRCKPSICPVRCHDAGG